MMTILETDELTETIQGLKAAANTVLERDNAEQFADFEKYVNEVEAFVRELQQSMWADQAKTAIHNLERGEQLTESDKEVIRIFLVSDAQRYLAHENNYGDWKRELKRLANDLVRRSEAADRDSIGDLRGVLKDAIRLVPNIRNYLEERQRVLKFEEALKNLDNSSRAMLARLMKEQLRSPKR